MLLPPVPDTPETRPGSGQSTLAKQENKHTKWAKPTVLLATPFEWSQTLNCLNGIFLKLWGKVGRPTVVDSCLRVKQHILISPSFSQWQEVHSQLILVISPSVRTRVPHWSPSRYKWDSSFTPPSYLHILISYLHPTLLPTCSIHNIKTDTSGKLSREKTFEVLKFCGYLRKFFSAKFWGVASFGGTSEQSAKVFSVKIFHQFALKSFPLYGILHACTLVKFTWPCSLWPLRLKHL